MPTEFCRHIKVDGLRCKSFAVRGASLCYFHRSMNAHRRLPPPPEPAIIHPLNGDHGQQREPLLAEPAATPLILDFPVLEDRESIQMALSMLLSALGQNRLEPRRASVMLYNLQVASSNARGLYFSDLDNTAVEVVPGPDGEDLAPDEDPEDVRDPSPGSRTVVV